MCCPLRAGEVVLNKPGWKHPDTGYFVLERNALAYALEKLENGTEEEKQEFLEWFYQDWYYED